VLQELARAHDESLLDTLDRLIEEARRYVLGQASAAYVAVASDPEADAAWRAEIAVWDVTSGDGLERAGTNPDAL
jgi:hypothetical protein